MEDALVRQVLQGEVRAVARAISVVESAEELGGTLVRALFGHGGRAWIVGVTGPPGAGKSTLVDRLISAVRSRGSKVAVLAVDPSSPMTGGALLGDRVRMQAHATDPDVYIRSMATRGYLGGLARATGDAVVVLDAAGFDVVFIETVGVGQDEVEVSRTADATLLTLVPGAGDDVQALKAGVMEIADVFVVNKRDLPGADRLVGTIEAMLALGAPASTDEWRPPVIATSGQTGEGVDGLLEILDRHRARAASARRARRRARLESALRTLLMRRFLAHVEQQVLAVDGLADLVDRLESRTLDPYTAADEVMSRTLS